MSEAPFKIIKLNYLDYIGLVEKRDNTLYIVNNDNETFSLFFKDKPIKEEKKEQLNIDAKEIVTVLKPYSETFSLSFNGKFYQIFGDGVASGETFSQTITRSSFESSGSSYTLSNFSSEGGEGIPGLFGEGNIYLGAASFIQFNTNQKPFLRNIVATTFPIIKIKVKMADSGSLRSVGFRTSSDQVCDSTNEIGEPTETKEFTSNGEVLEWAFGVEENIRFFQFVPGGNTNIESFEVITNNGIGAMEVDHKFVGKINKDGDFELGKIDNATKEIIPGGIKINKDGKLENSALDYDVTILNNKVDKVTGKGLSTEDYTTTEKNKLDGIQAGAQVNVQSDWTQEVNTADDYIKNKPAIPTKISDLTNDTGYITEYTETDPVFTAWNKSTGISITKSQVSDLIVATQSLSGLMSATDKQRLDVLHALLEEDTANNVVDSINEVLAIFNNYPEGADLITALAGKVDKVAGKGLSTNDLTNILKTNYDNAYTHSQSTHAPINAQKNSDITKAEIEAKLIGVITSHSHALPSHNHDDRYYTESEIDTMIGDIDSALAAILGV